MNKWVNGQAVEMSREELERFARAIPVKISGARAVENLIRMQLPALTETMSPGEVLSVEPLLKKWAPGAYRVGDVRTWEQQVWRCCQEHDSRETGAVIPGQSPSHWYACHGESREYAKPYVPPAGAHDAYRAGEWMIYRQRRYRCLEDATVHDPDTHPAAWEMQ